MVLPVSALLLAQTLELGRHVLVVANELRPEGFEVAEYYIQKRHVPAGNYLKIKTSPNDNVDTPLYKRQIEDRVRSRINSLKGIDYIVLAKGVPLRLDNKFGNSVDSQLAAMNLPTSPGAVRNPYYQNLHPFNSRTSGIYLVTRLDGYTVEDAKALIDRSLAAKAADGPFLFDGHTSKAPGYGAMNQSLAKGAAVVEFKGKQAIHDTTDRFIAPQKPLAGYASWGSNDSQFSAHTYKAIRFVPGAIAETFVSTSARTFKPTEGGQSLIADLIAGGVTGVKGYVSEPTTMALAKSEILFDRYLSGFNLAESFYAASPVVRWKDVIVGDPLCRPYGR